METGKHLHPRTAAGRAAGRRRAGAAGVGIALLLGLIAGTAASASTQASGSSACSTPAAQVVCAGGSFKTMGLKWQ